MHFLFVFSYLQMIFRKQLSGWIYHKELSFVLEPLILPVNQIVIQDNRQMAMKRVKTMNRQEFFTVFVVGPTTWVSVAQGLF